MRLLRPTPPLSVRVRPLFSLCARSLWRMLFVVIHKLLLYVKLFSFPFHLPYLHPFTHTPMRSPQQLLCMSLPPPLPCAQFSLLWSCPPVAPT